MQSGSTTSSTTLRSCPRGTCSSACAAQPMASDCEPFTNRSPSSMQGKATKVLADLREVGPAQAGVQPGGRRHRGGHQGALRELRRAEVRMHQLGQEVQPLAHPEQRMQIEKGSPPGCLGFLSLQHILGQMLRGGLRVVPSTCGTPSSVFCLDLLCSFALPPGALPSMACFDVLGALPDAFWSCTHLIFISPSPVLVYVIHQSPCPAAGAPRAPRRWCTRARRARPRRRASSTALTWTGSP